MGSQIGSFLRSKIFQSKIGTSDTLKNKFFFFFFFCGAGQGGGDNPIMQLSSGSAIISFEENNRWPSHIGNDIKITLKQQTTGVCLK